jgi:hypothetical protein
MHGDNADEGNIFRGIAAAPGTMDLLRSTATDIMGQAGREEILDIYGLLEPEAVSKEENEAGLTALAEDARFYVPSDNLARVWPRAAFYHLTVKSPFWTSPFPDDCFHTLDLLYVSAILAQELP